MRARLFGASMVGGSVSVPVAASARHDAVQVVGNSGARFGWSAPTKP